ncbi:gliding motility-associated C-terminal domain-containing protein [Hymenobacter sp. UYAg731]
MTAPSGCATLSDAAGSLLLYTNGDQVWNRQHQLMAGAPALGGDPQNPEGCAVVRVQGAPTAYILTQRVAFAAAPTVRGVPVAAEVSLSGAGGLGQVTQVNLPVVADTILTRLGSSDFAFYKTLVRHANGRDCWLVTRLSQQGVFLASLLDGSGRWPCARTVVSRVFSFGGSGVYAESGTIVASPDGRSLLYNDITTSYLLQFDPATGQVSSPLVLNSPAPTITPDFTPYVLGACFSADGSRVYVSRHYPPPSGLGMAIQVVQFDMAAGTPGAIAASGMQVYNVLSADGSGIVPWYMQRGPDGIIYFAMRNSPTLDAILLPNARGLACRYSAGYQTLAGRKSTNALPMQPNDVNLGALLQTEAVFGCAGQPVTLLANTGGSSTTTDSLRWDLGDGRFAIRTGLASSSLSVTYPTAGTYSLRIERRRQGAVVATALATVRIVPAPRVRLASGPDTTGCAPLNLRLSVGNQPAGSLFSWKGGSSAATLLATTPGEYWVDVQNPAGCTVRATVQVREKPCAAPTVTIPNIITPNGDDQNQAFALQGLNAADWTLHLYNRWGREIYQQEKYDNAWAATGQPDGLYYYLLTSAKTSQQYKGWLEVRR